MKIILSLIVVLLLFGCDESPGGGGSGDNNIGNNIEKHYETVKSSQPRDTTPDITSEEFRVFMDGNTDFALELYRTIALTAAPGDNLVFSPFSISTALGMTWAGAEGPSELEMADVLNFSQGHPVTHAGFNRLIASMGGKGTGDASEFAINIANSLWGQHDTVFGEPFLDTLGINYGAGLNLLDIAGDPEWARQVINAWVLQKTAGLISDLLPERALSKLTRLVLVNAIHFLGKWLIEFDHGETGPRPFAAPGGTYSTDFMAKSASYHYAEGADYQALELHYVDEEMSMLLVLPDATAFAAWEATMDATRLNEIIEALAPSQVLVRIPKFEFESEFKLSDMLKAMGMPRPFEKTAHRDFLPMMPELPPDYMTWIDDVYHKAFIAIDETKTEAAAATAVVMNVNTTSGSEQPVLFQADRPFFYFIRDRVTGAILFMGRIVRPESP